MRHFATSRPNEPPMPDPLAYFLTWATYGTWLPGDESGWVEYRRGFQPPDPIRELEARARMTEDACILNRTQRAIVEHTINRHCEIRRWHLHAVNCRTNHLHVVVTAQRDPDEVRNQFKAWCTRKLKEAAAKASRLPVRQNWWAERGSKQFLDTQEDLEGATQYVLEGQDLPH